MICPVCKNTKGFVCGTCNDCGFNHLTQEFTFIEVSAEDLALLVSESVQKLLTIKHAERWRRGGGAGLEGGGDNSCPSDDGDNA